MSECDCNYCQRMRTITPDTRNPVDKRLPPDKQREVLGGVSNMFMRRRAADPEAHFPEAEYVGRTPTRWFSDLAAWSSSPHARTGRSGGFVKDASDA